MMCWHPTPESLLSESLLRIRLMGRKTVHDERLRPLALVLRALRALRAGHEVAPHDAAHAQQGEEPRREEEEDGARQLRGRHLARAVADQVIAEGDHLERCHLALRLVLL
eukprot:13431268-Alexandrium_andersonii.AAC.2